MRAAPVWLAETDRLERALHLAGALARFWEGHGLRVEMRRWLECLLQRVAGHAGAAALRATAFDGLGLLVSRMRDVEQAAECYGQSLELPRAAGDRRGIACALDNLGYLADNRVDRGRSAILLVESLVL